MLRGRVAVPAGGCAIARRWRRGNGRHSKLCGKRVINNDQTLPTLLHNQTRGGIPSLLTQRCALCNGARCLSCCPSVCMPPWPGRLSVCLPALRRSLGGPGECERYVEDGRPLLGLARAARLDVAAELLQIEGGALLLRVRVRVRVRAGVRIRVRFREG